ncbi:hypothetical protein [Actinoallomurus sp. NPDC050550]|uniref:hypothetical protein n=1 Tax=Actinoallomurus sp. NPDC050550 TaxID=3154937 RepID=UPI0033EF949F
MTARAAVALAVLLPLAIGAPLWEQLRYYDRHRVREAVTTVPPGGSGVLDHASWRLLSLGRTATGVRVRLAKTPLDQDGVSNLEVVVDVRDRSGRRWMLRQDLSGAFSRPGHAETMTLRGDVPADVADQVEPEVRHSPLKPEPRPVPVLRFRR